MDTNDPPLRMGGRMRLINNRRKGGKKLHRNANARQQQQDRLDRQPPTRSCRDCHTELAIVENPNWRYNISGPTVHKWVYSYHKKCENCKTCISTIPNRCTYCKKRMLCSGCMYVSTQCNECYNKTDDSLITHTLLAQLPDGLRPQFQSYFRQKYAQELSLNEKVSDLANDVSDIMISQSIYKITDPE